MAFLHLQNIGVKLNPLLKSYPIRVDTGRKRQHIIMRGREQEDEVKGSEAEIRGTLHATIPEVHLPPKLLHSLVRCM